MSNDRQPSCKERVRAEYRREIATIRKLWEQYVANPEAHDDEYGNWTEHGLCFAYVPPGTDQKRGFFRYQISTGGPGDEFRFYCDERLQLTRVEYWFLDWFDGAKVVVNGAARKLCDEIWADWLECEVPQSAMKSAE